MIQHDSEGFLIGKKLDTANALLREVRDGVLSLRDVMLAMSRSGGSNVVTATRRSTLQPSAARNGRNSASGAAHSSDEELRVSTAQRTAVPRAKTPPVTSLNRSTITAMRRETSTAIPAQFRERSRDALGRFVSGASKPKTVKAAPKSAADRDALGRFTRNSDGSETSKGFGLLSRAIGNMGSELGNTLSDSENIDPTIGAAKEIGGALKSAYATVAPVGRGMASLFRTGQNRETVWYKRIWQELKWQRRDDNVANARQNRTLDEISNRTGGDNGGSGVGIFGVVIGLFALLAAKLKDLFPALGKLPKLFESIPGFSRVTGSVSRGANAAAGAGMGLLGKLGKRLPWIAALMSAGNVFANESDEGMNRRQKDQANGKTVGGLGGSLAGAWAGAQAGGALGALAGPIGAAIGSAVGGIAGAFFGSDAGAILGETAGGWVNDLRETDIGGFMMSTWSSLTTEIQAEWAAVTAVWNNLTAPIQAEFTDAIEKFSAIWDSVSKWLQDKFGVVVDAGKKAIEGGKELLNDANNYVKGATGVDVKANVEKGYDKAVDATSNLIESGVNKTKSWYESAKSAAGEMADAGGRWIDKNVSQPGSKAYHAVKDKTGSAINSGKGWMSDKLGSLSERFESNGNAGAIGNDSTGGYSYGKYQIATKTGTMDKFLDWTKDNAPDVYSQLQAAGGSSAAMSGDDSFKSAWKSLAKDKAFGDAQHNFIKTTHFDPLAARTKENTGIDVSQRSKALQDVLWSTSVQHGGNTNVVEKALAKTGKSGDSVGDEELIRAIYDERGTRFGSSTGNVRKSVLNRFKTESEMALSSLATVPPAVATAQGPRLPTVSASALSNPPNPPKAVSVPPVSEPPRPDKQKPLQLASAGGSQFIPDVGQDVSDRTIAHIVTGGYSSTGGSGVRIP